ncbi:hypothetical protein EVJ58_g8328 [Rhodofomes roseus]|uniref:Uncharacterized protein n=1 Tax=Rhodofomes roseus TaxID=34475 RepID=A0A4Y9XZT6_9APHY|nr:hypothetical protein EVJ58_g8328 [Rhodofomes roseus]
MLVAPYEDDNNPDANTHPYWYARVLGIFHVNIKHRGLLSKSKHVQRMDVLWIRWLGRDLTAPGGFETYRLHRLGFVDSDSPNAFGFLDPAQVLRACHLIPGFAYGKTTEYLPRSIARQPDEDNKDYVYYYVGMFVDRDMLMRYLGGAVGHKGLPSNRITAKYLLDKVKQFIGLCKVTQSPRYPKEAMNSALLDELWRSAEAAGNGVDADHDHAAAGEAMHEDQAEPGAGSDTGEAGSDEDDFDYNWEYSSDEHSNSGDDPEREAGSGELNSVDGDMEVDGNSDEDGQGDLGPEDDMNDEWVDEYEQEGYAPL